MKKLSILNWYGGKYRMLNDILPFPKHKMFLEVFAGSAVITLNKIPSKIEVVNDINGNLINFWSTLRDHYIELKLRSEMEIESRELFEKYKEPTGNDLEDAFRFFYYNSFGFSGLDTFNGIHKEEKESTKAYFNKIERIEQIHERIKFIKFENQDYSKILKRFKKHYDFEDTCIFVDSPYLYGGEAYENQLGNTYKWNPKTDFIHLMVLLRDFEHAKIICTIDIPDFITYNGWNRQTIIRTNSASPSNNHIKKEEYIYRNFDNDSIEKIVQTKHKNVRKL